MGNTRSWRTRKCAAIVRPESRHSDESNFEMRIGELREASVIPPGGRLCQHFFGRIGQSQFWSTWSAAHKRRGCGALASIRRLKKQSGPRISIRGPRRVRNRLGRSRSASSQTSCSCRTGSRAQATRKACSSADLACERGNTPSSLPEEPGPEQEPAWGPEPCWGPGSERQEPRSSGPTHSRRRNQPGHSSSVCSSRRQLRNRTDARPFPRDGGPSDRSRPRRRSGPPRLPCCSSKDCGGGCGRFPRPHCGGRVHRRHSGSRSSRTRSRDCTGNRKRSACGQLWRVDDRSKPSAMRRSGSRPRTDRRSKP